ncbi:MAG: tRNA 2-thiouridine(34) synthase MnmA [Candidatus Dormibacteraeota bacterium]|nr:tRNA 2-thiouridine(34) synthase MnmA [Candidatus Dormibacteraeota bacterium]
MPTSVLAVAKSLTAAAPSGCSVAVAMSGGVDSSVAAAISVAAGLDTFGVTMRLWGAEEAERGEGGCCSLDAVEDARRVCSRLGIPHYVLNMRDHFRATVIADFLAEYQSGRTPNPCIRCNEKVKFAELIRRVAAVGATHVATGHYAVVERAPDGCFTLSRASDLRKDQSYTLYRCDQEVLSRTLLPLGRLQKAQVRALAGELGLPVAHKPDSQDLCFVGGGDHRVVLERELAGRFSPGPMVATDGAEIGVHRGIPFYTVGQRQGLGVGAAQPNAAPHYVVELDVAHNRVVVGPREALNVSSCMVSRAAYPGGRPPQKVVFGEAQTRAHAKPVPASWFVLQDGYAKVEFTSPQIGIAVGQSVVLYDGDRVVAGGDVQAVVRQGGA